MLPLPFGVRFIFAWYDFWVGVFWDTGKKKLYIFPVPCFGVVLDFGISGVYGVIHWHDAKASYNPVCGEFLCTCGDINDVSCHKCLAIYKDRLG